MIKMIKSDRYGKGSDRMKKGLAWKLAAAVAVALLLAALVGMLLGTALFHTERLYAGEGVFYLGDLADVRTWGLGVGVVVFGAFMYLVFGKKGPSVKKLLGGEAKGVDSPLENSRFLTDKERDRYFPPSDYEALAASDKDGVPVRAVLDKKGHLQVNFLSGVHSLVIGATGSGKTTTFINPMIQLIGATSGGSSMVMTDPKGELFDLHSKYLQSRGYKVMVLDLRDTYSSYRWNPLDPIWDAYQDYIEAGKGIFVHKDSKEDYPDLKMVGTILPGDRWYEYRGEAWADREKLIQHVSVVRQRIYDEMYEDLSDLIAGICPITNEKDPLWEKGARSIVTATVLAMLEDSEDPELGMTREKFNFFNINKILTNSANEYQAVKRYFEGRSPLSQAVSLSRQVLSAADQTMSSYMSITFDKLSLFNDRGVCGLTSATDIYAEDFAFRPTALFLKIPDEKDTRHSLASLFILSMYKALIKVASGREDLSLPRNVYFIMDEFGNMPKIEKFDKMITVGRSRKIWFNMVVQSYTQLNNIYGEGVADVVKSNCGLKMFIGSNDIGTCEEFSKLCGNVTVSTRSVSSSTGSKEGDVSVSTQLQTRPLVYPSELQKLNNKDSTGNAIIVTFGNFPLKTKYTPSYKCPLYQFGKMDLTEAQENVFLADRAFYDIERRNKLRAPEEESA